MTLLKGSRALIFAVGGGGDVASAGYLKNILDGYYKEIYLCCIPWERSVYDPTPGPIKYDEVYNARMGDGYAIVNGGSYAIRNGRKIYFQAVKLSRVLNEEVFIVSPIYGLDSMVYGLENILKEYGIDVLISLDVGGDILSTGYEDGLWSPLSDSFGLASTYILYEKGFTAYIAVSSIGADGELDKEYLLERISRIAGEGGLLRVIGYGSLDLSYMDKILGYVDTEASSIAYKAVKGFKGRIPIRGGSRTVDIDVTSILIFFLDPALVYKYSTPAKIVRRIKSFEEVNMEFIRNGIPTEYEFERILYDLRKNKVDKNNLYEKAREILLNKLKKFKS